MGISQPYMTAYNKLALTYNISKLDETNDTYKRNGAAAVNYCAGYE